MGTRHMGFQVSTRSNEPPLTITALWRCQAGSGLYPRRFVAFHSIPAPDTVLLPATCGGLALDAPPAVSHWNVLRLSRRTGAPLWNSAVNKPPRCRRRQNLKLGCVTPRCAGGQDRHLVVNKLNCTAAYLPHPITCAAGMEGLPSVCRRQGPAVAILGGIHTVRFCFTVR